VNLSSTKSSILIVDDELVIREVLERILSAGGYDLAFASSGAEALAKAAELTPDLILLDVMMPVMDGFEACRRLRADPLLAEVPVIMVTALDDRDSRLRGIEAGADDFIAKPFDKMELQVRVRAITKLDRYRRLLSERAKFERAIELSPNGIMIVDARGTICLANPAMLRLVGAEREKDVVGKKSAGLCCAGAVGLFLQLPGWCCHRCIAGRPRRNLVRPFGQRELSRSS